ncbi:aspartate aminotransferase family protein [Phenylobacterium sp.]|uniref:aspartate aminotransferase family protein n=1 Tax=Phenylobacterium sp. TaxID=1871053 RepID=UPI0025E430D6|nr:aspartate aminotransferase family protein [Phenylobacterium sp.]MBX3485635.1 aspartate aminotransferase family protein [Phenylobacterium sp.]MCW5759793.1 aspartate aminotransferase family protein [Phenylobacterium sp.]
MDDASHDLANRTDMSAFWMPFTANRQFKAAPRMVVSASGMYYRSDDGREILDGTAGLWCVNAGHGRPEIAAAVQHQLMTLDYASSFNAGHPLAFDFANRLAKIAPPGLDRVFFVNSGSEAADTALKMAIAYHRARGEGQRVRLVGRERGYHGVGFGGISVGGLVNNRRVYPLLSSDHLRHTHDPARNAFSRGLPEHGAEWADELEQLVALHGAETIAAVMIEPVAGAGGVLPPPKGYLERLRALCDKHGILLIFDEVITGFGRTGSAFASTLFGVTPDIMTTAKGITNAAIPCGAVFASRKVHDTVIAGGAEGAVEFFHGYTYSGHPVAMAAGLATLDIYDREGLFAHAAAMSPVWEAALHGLRDIPVITDIRNLGLMGAIDLAPRPGAPGARGYEAMVRCFDQGLTVRMAGDFVALSPPLIIDEAQIGQIADTLRRVIASLD